MATTSAAEEMEKFQEKEDVIIEINEVESSVCECCGLIEDCTPDYNQQVKDSHSGKWLCGLCSEAVQERIKQVPRTAIEEAVKSHMDFCNKFNSTRLNPKLSLAKAMGDLAKRCSQYRTNNSPTSNMAPSRNSSDPRINFRIR